MNFSSFLLCPLIDKDLSAFAKHGKGEILRRHPHLLSCQLISQLFSLSGKPLVLFYSQVQSETIRLFNESKTIIF